MNRLNFIRSFITVIAAPKLILETSSYVGPPQKRAVFFKIAKQMMANEYKEDLENILRHECEKRGIDVSRSTIRSGYDNDDFTKNLITVVIEEKVFLN